jgi:lysophospholipid hydrolase
LELEESQELFEVRLVPVFGVKLPRVMRCEYSGTIHQPNTLTRARPLGHHHQGTESLELSPNQVLFRQGDASESGIYIVVAGALGLYRQDEAADGSAEGPPLLTNILHEGESVGDVDVMDAATRSVSAIAQAPEGCRLVVVSRQLFLTFVAAHPRSLHTYLTQAIARLWRVAHFVLADYLGLPRAAQERLPLGPGGATQNGDTAAALAGTDASPACEADLRELATGTHAAALNAAARRCLLAPEQVLYAEHDPGETLFLLVSGSVRADAVPWPAGTGVSPPPVHAPALLGAASFLSRTPRRETLRCVVTDSGGGDGERQEGVPEADAGGALVLAIGTEELEALLNANTPAFVALLLAAAGSLSPVIRRFIALGLNRVWLASGDAAFTRDAPASSLYILISGRVRLIRDGASGSAPAELLGSSASGSDVQSSVSDSSGAWDSTFGGASSSRVEEAGRGDTIGEASLLAGGVHDATALCVRDSELVRMSRAAFQLITARYPAAAARLLEAMARKLTRHAAGGGAPGVGPSVGSHSLAGRGWHRPDLVTICVLPCAGTGVTPTRGPEAASAAFAGNLATALGRFGPVLTLDKAAVAARFTDGTMMRLGSRFYRSKLTGWMATQEEAYRFILLLADTGASAWSRVCVSQADCVLLVGRAGDPPTPGPGEAALLWSSGGTRRAGIRTELVLLSTSAPSSGGGDTPHTPSAPPATLPTPSGTAAWLDARPMCRSHHHARAGSDRDASRLARHLANRAVGLLLSGAGARGLAHVGALRALADAGVPVDVVGGTGTGALVAAAFARGASQRTLLRRCAALSPLTGGSGPHSLLADATLPLVSFFTGWGLTSNARAAVGDSAIEDLWLRFFCCSTNLTRGALQVHERGPAARAVCAAQTVLGLQPPVSDPVTGDLLCDGGYLTNYPVDAMRERFGCDIVIVADADDREPAPSTALRCLGPADGGVSGWRLLWERLNPLSQDTRRDGLILPRGSDTGGAASLPSAPSRAMPRYGTLVSALVAAVNQRQLRLAAASQPIHLHLRPKISIRGVLSKSDAEACVRAAYKHSFAAICEWQAAQAGRMLGMQPDSGVMLISASAATGQHQLHRHDAGPGMTMVTLPVLPPAAAMQAPPHAVMHAPPVQAQQAQMPPMAPSASGLTLRRALVSRTSVVGALNAMAIDAPPSPIMERRPSSNGSDTSGRRKSLGEKGPLGSAPISGDLPPGGASSALSARFSSDTSLPHAAADTPPEVAEALLRRAASAEVSLRRVSNNGSGNNLSPRAA